MFLIFDSSSTSSDARRRSLASAGFGSLRFFSLRCFFPPWRFVVAPVGGLRVLADLPEGLSGLPEVAPLEVGLSILLGLPEFVSGEGCRGPGHGPGEATLAASNNREAGLFVTPPAAYPAH